MLRLNKCLLFLVAAASSAPGARAQTTSSGGTDLGGSIITRTNVEYLADLSLDVRDIRQFITTPGGSSAALDIYTGGRNSQTQPGVNFSLRRLSSDLSEAGISAGSPNYLFHLYGVTGRSTELNQLQNNAAYADAYIISTMNSQPDLAGDAVLALSMWMYATHVLNHGAETCQKMVEADNPSQFEAELGGGGMDEFIALWLGSGQEPGSNCGNGLYAFAERAATFFGKSSTGTESAVNKQIKSLYQQAAGVLSVGSACTKDNTDSSQQLWSFAQQIISLSTVPLMQMLIKSVMDRNVEATKLYALAVVPQVAQCRPSIYKRLNDALLDGSPNFGRSEQILKDLLDVSQCFGYSCSDLGDYASDQAVTLPACPKAEDAQAMAEYLPTTSVNPVSCIFIEVSSPYFGIAEDKCDALEHSQYFLTNVYSSYSSI